MVDRTLFGIQPLGTGRQVEIDAKGNLVGFVPPPASRPVSSPQVKRPVEPSARISIKPTSSGKGKQMSKGNSPGRGNPFVEFGKKYATDSDFRGKVNTGVSDIFKVIKPSTPSNQGGKGYLSEVPNPAESQLNTGVKLSVLEKNYTKAEEGVCASMHTSHVLFKFPDTSSALAYDWYTKINVRDYQSKVQEVVNWAVDTSTKFSPTAIVQAMNQLFEALQVYFFYRSVISYCRPGDNQNDAMYSIEAEFNFETKLKLQQIARLLARTPIPPKMLEFCRYIQSNFLSGEMPNSTIIKIVPFAMQSGGARLTPSDNLVLTTVIGYLDNAANKDVWNTLARANKTWVKGIPDNLYDPPIEPRFDRDFITIFNNLPFATGITSYPYAPYASTNVTGFSYLSWNNNLDGIAPALTDCFLADTTEVTHNDVVKVKHVGSGSAKASRFSYYKVSGVTQWYSSRAYPFLRDSRTDVYWSDGTSLTTAHRPGTDMVINMTPLMCSTTVVNYIDYLLDSSDIKRDVQDDKRRAPRGGR